MLGSFVLASVNLSSALSNILGTISGIVALVGALGFLICAVGMALGVGTGKRELVAPGAAIVIGISAHSLANILAGSG